jgi:hypothetical protein
MAENSASIVFDAGPLKDAINRQSETFKTRIHEQLEAWAQVAARQAAAAAPRGPTGKLAGSIRVSEKRHLAVQVRALARYAHWPEFGTITRHHRRTGKSVGKVTGKSYFVVNVQATRARMWTQFERLLAQQVKLV